MPPSFDAPRPSTALLHHPHGTAGEPSSHAPNSASAPLTPSSSAVHPVPKDSYVTTTIDYPALVRNGTTASRRFSLRRTLSRMSKRSYMSNLSVLNRKNLARFGKSKITFLIFNTMFTFVALSVLLACVFTWANNFLYAPFIKLLREDLLIMATGVSGLMSIVGFLGFLGAFTHRKTVLTVYNVLCWPVLGGFIALAYLAYRDVNGTQWENILSLRWDELYASRQLIQMKFNCCGFYSELDRPWVDAQCTGLVDSSTDTSSPPTTYPNSAGASNATTASVSPSLRRRGRSKSQRLERRQQASTTSGLSGCHDAWDSFSSTFLRLTYSVSFAIVPLVLLMFIVGVLGSNHIYD
ncbi:Tetraspanin family-domain-containing protein [Cladochytrium replicatum]|nr:Tetraspanin family-domain-containing protein [Cladochytrium replicatum]